MVDNKRYHQVHSLDSEVALRQIPIISNLLSRDSSL